MYHERQHLWLCGVHALNNLCQQEQFHKQDFDQVCEELDASRYWNQHRSPWGVGNYDVNVLLVLLERQNWQVKWHDARQDISSQVLQEFGHEANQFGVVVNVPSTSWHAKITKGRHWLTLLQTNDMIWMNLDSELKEPQTIGNTDACAALLQEWQQEHNKKGKGCHILLVKK